MDQERRKRGMSAEVLQAASFFKNGKSHAECTLHRRMSPWRTVCAWDDREHPLDDPRLK